MAFRPTVGRLRGAIFLGNFPLTRSIKIQQKVVHQSKGWACTRWNFSTSTIVHSQDVSVRYENGLPVLSVPLPSRHETCQFTLKPVTNTLGDFLSFLQEEDRGVDRVAAYTEDGVRIAGSTTVDILLQSPFQLVINDERYAVTPPEIERLDVESLQQLSDIKSTIAQLYSSLHVEKYQVEREQELQARLENLRMELKPFEEIKDEIEIAAHTRMNYLSWLGLGMMGLQFGVLARLTWWEYSWDIMEPVTYFVTYGTTIGLAAYYVLTKQEYNYNDVRNREFLLTLHRAAKKKQLSIHQYNTLKDDLAQAEYDLARLRDPLQMQLPIQSLMLYQKPPGGKISVPEAQ